MDISISLTDVESQVLNLALIEACKSFEMSPEMVSEEPDGQRAFVASVTKVQKALGVEPYFWDGYDPTE